MVNQVLTLLVNSGVFYSLSKIFPGFKIRNEKTAVIIALLFSVVSYCISLIAFPLLSIFKTLLFPFTFIPILGKLVASAILQIAIFIMILTIFSISLMIIDSLLDDFEIDSYKTAICISLIIAIVNVILSIILS